MTLLVIDSSVFTVSMFYRKSDSQQKSFCSYHESTGCSNKSDFERGK